MRKGDKGPERIVASEDSELQPGDAVDVSLRYQDRLDAPSRRLSSSNVPSAADATGNDSLRVGSR